MLESAFDEFKDEDGDADLIWEQIIGFWLVDTILAHVESWTDKSMLIEWRFNKLYIIMLQIKTHL